MKRAARLSRALWPRPQFGALPSWLGVRRPAWYRKGMASDAEPRDLLAERIRRLEGRIADLSDELIATRGQMQRAGTQLDTLVDLVGRLSRVVDVQGTTLHGDENALGRKVDSVEERVGELAGGLSAVIRQLEAIRAEIERAVKRESAG